MKRQIYTIDSDGFILERYIGSFSVDGILIEPIGDYVTTPLPQPLFHRPKWNGKEWIEGATQDEIDELIKPQPYVPTDTEILGQQMTEREIESMIQGQQITDMELRLIMLEAK